MKIPNPLLVCVLVIGLCAAGSAQAFCFLKGKNSARGMSHYTYPLPPVAFAPTRYYAYPYSVPPFDAGQVQPDYIPVQQEDSLLIRDRGTR